jgi:cytochrome P450
MTTDAGTGTQQAATQGTAGFRFNGAGPVGDGMDRYDRLRAGPAVQWVEEPGGSYWMVLRRDLIRSCLQDPQTFSSAAVTPMQPDPPLRLTPIQLDPPEHGRWRQLLAGYFSPRRMTALRERMTQGCADLLDEIEGRAEVDFVEAFATRFPTILFLELMGLPVAELDRFLAWERVILHGRPDGQDLYAGMRQLMGYLTARIAERRAAAGDGGRPAGTDIISQALTWRLDGVPVPDSALLSCCVLLFLAGLDTVTNTLAFALHHLATHPDDQRQVRELARAGQPMGAVVEEMLRYYSIPALARKITRDTDLAGQRLRAGQMILLPLAAANRDEVYAADAGRVRIERGPTPHLAFGAGPHRCLGSHLAREELGVALAQWHQRLPAYTLDDRRAPVERWGSVHGIDAVPLRFS